MKAVSIWIEKFRSVLDNGRGHSVVVDLPNEKGGDNTGATALELAVMGLAGCITTIFRIVANKRRLYYKTMKVTLDAEQDTPTITKVNGTVEIVTDASEEEVETAFDLTLKNCPVGALFEKAGVKISWNLIVKKPT